MKYFTSSLFNENNAFKKFLSLRKILINKIGNFIVKYKMIAEGE